MAALKTSNSTITKRWVRGSLLFTLAVVAVAEILFLFYTVTSYQSNVRNAIEKELNTIEGRLAMSATQSSTRETDLRRVVEEFEYKDRFELMLVDMEGNVVATSSGVLPSVPVVAPDIEDALRPGATSSGVFMGENENGEQVMAVTMRTPYSSGGIVAMRIVTSMELVNRSILSTVLGSIVLLMLIVLASVVSGVYFIRSIVIPLRKIESTASRIAEGDFGIRIQNNSNDEIGSLCKTINHMAWALGQNERMKNEFISSVSHELRTPLTSIKGWAETVSRTSSPDDPVFRRGVEIIGGETDRLYGMVEDLLDFSRMQNGLTLEREKLDLAAEVEEAVLFSQALASSQGICLAYEAPEMPVAVQADKNRLRQVFVNVLDNAIKYSQAGDTISVELTSVEAWAQIDIRDEGRGIAEDDLENVRAKFYKGKGAVRGSGIGLAVVDEIVKAHGGEMKIESELGVGTTVRLRIPLNAVPKPNLLPKKQSDN